MKCGGGIQRITRGIKQQPQNGGADCVGERTRERLCNTNRCSCFFVDVGPAAGSTYLGSTTYEFYDTAIIYYDDYYDDYWVIKEKNDEYLNANTTAKGCQELCQVCGLPNLHFLRSAPA